MLNYILRRTFYSIWVIAGVLVLTFVLFNMSAGDPAAAVLGKNARPEEVELFRESIGGDLPLFYGKYCQTEAFSPWHGEAASTVEIPRNFKRSNITARITLQNGTTLEQNIPDECDKAELTAPGAERITGVEFFRKQNSPWNSQLKRSLTEAHTSASR